MAEEELKIKVENILDVENNDYEVSSYDWGNEVNISLKDNLIEVLCGNDIKNNEVNNGNESECKCECGNNGSECNCGDNGCKCEHESTPAGGIDAGSCNFRNTDE